MLEKKEKNLRYFVDEAFQEQEQERKKADIVGMLKFLHPIYYSKLVNDRLDNKKQRELFELIVSDEESLRIFCENICLPDLHSIFFQRGKIDENFEILPEEILKKLLEFTDEKSIWYLFEHLFSEKKVYMLMLLSNQKLEKFLICVLQERKEETFRKWLQDRTEDDVEILKKKFLKLIASMKENEEVVLQCIPDAWLDEMLEQIMEKIETTFSHIPDNCAIEILLQCNQNNFSAICQKIAGICYEDVSLENQIAFLKRLKKYKIEISSFFSSWDLTNSYKVAKTDGKKTILFDIVADMKEELQQSILDTLYHALEKQEKLSLLEMISDETETEKFWPKKVIAVQFKKILEQKQEVEVFEKVFLEHFQTWLKSSLLNNEK